MVSGVGPCCSSSYGTVGSCSSNNSNNNNSNNSRLRFYSSLFGAEETRRKIAEAEAASQALSVSQESDVPHSTSSSSSSSDDSSPTLRPRNTAAHMYRVLLGIETILAIEEKLRKQKEGSSSRCRAVEDMSVQLFHTLDSGGNGTSSRHLCHLLLRSTPVLRLNSVLISSVTNIVQKSVVAAVQAACDPLLLCIHKLDRLASLVSPCCSSTHRVAVYRKSFLGLQEGCMQSSDPGAALSDLRESLLRYKPKSRASPSPSPCPSTAASPASTSGLCTPASSPHTVVDDTPRNTALTQQTADSSQSDSAECFTCG